MKNLISYASYATQIPIFSYVFKSFFPATKVCNVCPATKDGSSFWNLKSYPLSYEIKTLQRPTTMKLLPKWIYTYEEVDDPLQKQLKKV